MFLQFHLLTTFPPHNVNRDEDGRPKTVTFGGTLRGRISSQAKKRALRYAAHFAGLQRSVRTREAGVLTFISVLLGRVVDDPERRREAFEAAVREVLALTKVDPNREIAAIRAGIAVSLALGAGEGVTKVKGIKPDEAGAKKFLERVFATKKKAGDDVGESAVDEALPGNERIGRILPNLRSEQGLVVSTREMAQLNHLLDQIAKGALQIDGFVEHLEAQGLLNDHEVDEDTGLFGRMVAADPRFNIEAAASVSHAITTHTFAVEGDYFSAGEELNVLGGTGAAITSYGFLGSGVYYQHAVLDVRHLRTLLRDDIHRTRNAIAAFVDGLVHAQPKGKRNAFASDVAAAYVLCDRGEAPTTNLASAFLQPVRVADGDDPMLRSIARLEEFHDTVKRAYALPVDSLAFVAHPSRRRGNEPPDGEAWTIDALHRFALDAVA